MLEFEKKELHEYTPCRFNSMDKIVEALAVVHTELVLIHPFREGNGRIARLLSILILESHRESIIMFPILPYELSPVLLTYIF